jgi:hypothetical protein
VFDSEWVSAWNNIVGKDSCGTQAQVLRVANEVLKYYSNTVGYNLEGADLALRSQLRELAAASRSRCNGGNAALAFLNS